MTNTQTIPSIPVIPMNPEIDLIARVEAARRAKGTSPFVGIATPKGTLMLRRDVLKKSLQGLRVIDAELIEAKEGMITGTLDFYAGRTSYRSHLALRVHAVGERAKAVRLYIHQPWKIGAGVFHKDLESWQRANMRKWGVCDCYDFARHKTCSHIETATRPKLNKYEKAIAKLEKEMPRERRPQNPAVSEYQPQLASADERRSWHTWKLQKGTRRAVMAIARRGARDLSSTQIYAEVAKLTAPYFGMVNHHEVFNGSSPRPEPVYQLETHSITVRKWGEITARQREHAGLQNLFYYMNKLWEFCGLEEKPRGKKYYEHAPTWGADHYKSWLHDLHTRKQLESQIAAIRAEAQP